MIAPVASTAGLDCDASFLEAERQFRAQYDIMERLGEGNYGKVYKATCRHTGQLKALKQMKFGSEDGVPSTAMREIAILKGLSHENIVSSTMFSASLESLCLYSNCWTVTSKST